MSSNGICFPGTQAIVTLNLWSLSSIPCRRGSAQAISLFVMGSRGCGLTRLLRHARVCIDEIVHTQTTPRPVPFRYARNFAPRWSYTLVRMIRVFAPVERHLQDPSTKRLTVGKHLSEGRSRREQDRVVCTIIASCLCRPYPSLHPI